MMLWTAPSTIALVQKIRQVSFTISNQTSSAGTLPFSLKDWRVFFSLLNNAPTNCLGQYPKMERGVPFLKRVWDKLISIVSLVL
jgi:hypothetical protein